MLAVRSTSLQIFLQVEIPRKEPENKVDNMRDTDSLDMCG